MKKLESEGKCSTVAALTGGSRILGDLGTLREAKLWQGHQKSLKITGFFEIILQKSYRPSGQVVPSGPALFHFFRLCFLFL